MVPGASVAAIALAGGNNANLLFKWRRDHLRSTRPIGSSSSSAVLVPVQVTPNLAGGSQPLVLPPDTPATVAATAAHDAQRWRHRARRRRRTVAPARPG
jgi:transposase